MGGDKDSIQSPQKTTLKLKVPSLKDGKEPSSVSDVAQNRVTQNSVSENLREKLLSMLKIITLATIADDETSDGFFLDFNIYISMAKDMSDLKLIAERDVPDEDAFSSNPPECWMKIIMAIFVALYSFPDNSGVYCDIITSDGMKGSMDRRPLGTYFSTMLRLEAYDWKEHKIDCYIPNVTGERILFLVDDEPALYTLVPR